MRGDESQWQLLREIGRGQFGIVSAAVNDLGQPAAIKRLKAEYAKQELSVRRFLREIAALRTLEHEAFPRLLDQGLHEEVPFLAMELLEGETVETRRQRRGGRLDVSFVMDLARKLLGALAYAHRSGIVHRDICPNNLFVTRTGEFKLLDLGLCQAVELSGALAYLTGQTGLGTPGFIAPESEHDSVHCIGAKADLWSLGATLHLLLTGSPVPSRLRCQALVSVEPSTLVQHVPDPVARWLERAMAFDPSCRWQSAEAMLSAMPELDARHCAQKSAVGASEVYQSGLILCPSTADQSLPTRRVDEQRLSLHVVCCPDVEVHRPIPLPREGSVVLGRHPGTAQRCFEDEQISRLHARIDWDERAGAHRVLDLGSRNGVAINGKRSNTGHMRAGDVLRLGQTLMVVVDEICVKSYEDSVAAACGCDAPVFIVGETGVGKDRLARLIHERSKRTGELIAVNCASLTHELAASELFGHERGAFTGANRARHGLFRAAHQGTLVLDEIGDMPRPLQAILLRAIQESTVRPIGSTQEYPVDVRIVAATNVPLDGALSTGQFRLDLYARLSAIRIRLSPLGERRQELLAILKGLMNARGIAIGIEASAAEALLLAHWSTNVRGLQRLVTSLASSQATATTLTLSQIEDFEPELVANWHKLKMAQSGESVRVPVPADILRQRVALLRCLEEHGGSVSRVAAELRTTRAQVYRWMKRHGIELGSGTCRPATSAVFLARTKRKSEDENCGAD